MEKNPNSGNQKDWSILDNTLKEFINLDNFRVEITPVEASKALDRFQHVYHFGNRSNPNSKIKALRNISEMENEREKVDFSDQLEMVEENPLPTQS